MDSRFKRSGKGLVFGMAICLITEILFEFCRPFDQRVMTDQCPINMVPQTGFAFYPGTGLLQNTSQCLPTDVIYYENNTERQIFWLYMAITAFAALDSFLNCGLCLTHEANTENDDEIDAAPPQLLEIKENEHEKRLREVGYEGEIPEAFLDPVWQSIMFNPVILITKDHTTSQSIDESTALYLIENQTNPVCPLTRSPFSDYILNRDLKRMIQAWVDNKVAELSSDWSQLPREQSKLKMIEFATLFAKRKPLPIMSKADQALYIRRLS